MRRPKTDNLGRGVDRLFPPPKQRGIVNKQLCETQPLLTLAKGDKVTLTVERIAGGKLRATFASCYPIRRI
jgi:hypothetical protein